jgi:hypothetical protein
MRFHRALANDPYELRHFIVAAANSCCRRTATRRQPEAKTDSILAAGNQHQGFTDVAITAHA